MVGMTSSCEFNFNYDSDEMRWKLI